MLILDTEKERTTQQGHARNLRRLFLNRKKRDQITSVNIVHMLPSRGSMSLDIIREFMSTRNRKFLNYNSKGPIRRFQDEL